MGGSDGLVFFTGAGLIIANELVDGDLSEMWALITKGTQPTNFPQRGLVILGEAVFLIILLVISKISPGSSRFVITLLLILWFVWTMMHPNLLSGLQQVFAQKQPGVVKLVPGPGGVYTGTTVTGK